MVWQQSVMLIGSHLEEITCILTVKRRMKGSSSKIPVNCPNGIKLYNTKMGGVDLMDQLKSAYQLDWRLEFRFYLCLFFDLFDVALVNSFIVHKKLENKDLTLKQFKICIALKLIVSFVSQKLSWLNHRSLKRTKAQRPGSIPPSYFPIFYGDKTTVYCMLPSRKREQNNCYVFIMWCSPFPSKRKKLFFYNITHKLAVTHNHSQNIWD